MKTTLLAFLAAFSLVAGASVTSPISAERNRYIKALYDSLGLETP
jgi:hypothetical protein